MWVEYHSALWSLLVETGWVTHIVQQMGSVQMAFMVKP